MLDVSSKISHYNLTNKRRQNYGTNKWNKNVFCGRYLHIAKETAYAIMKAKEAGARYIGRKLLISEDNLRRYLNNEKN